jgi:hypothetical protein
VNSYRVFALPHLLALGRDGDARAAAREFIVRTLKLNNANSTEYLVAGTLTSLETLVKAKPDTAGRVQAMKEYLTNAAAKNSPDPSTGDRRTADVQLMNVTAGSLTWGATIAGFQNGRDHVSVQWYYRDPGKVAWTGLPTPSGSYTELPPDGSLGPEGYGRHDYFLARSGQCLHDGSYRVEIYINGKLAGTKDSDFTPGSLQGHRWLDVGVAACAPQDWTPTANALTGFENGYVSPGKDAGVLVFSFQDAAFGGSSDPHVNSSKYLALTMGAFAKQFPSPPKFEQTPSGQSFITLDGANTQFFSYPGGLVEVGAGVRKDDGSVLVGIVYGPRSSFDTPASVSSVLYSSLDLAL